jgi:hypothetical protein
LSYISKAQKKVFYKEGFVLCRDASKNTHIMRNAGLTTSEIDQVITDAYELCATKNHKN